MPALGALVALIWWARTPESVWLSHDHAPTNSPALTLAVFTLGWMLMVTAMMTPTLLPLFTAMGRISASTTAYRWIVAGGYSAVWLAVGLTMRLGDLVLHRAVNATPSLAARPHLVTAALLAAGAAVQLSEIVSRNAKLCRGPATLIMRYWRGSRPAAEAFNIGVSYGASCAVCCAALTGVMFAVGMTNPLWMLALGSLMAVLKTRKAGPIVERLLTLALSIGALGFALAG